jgi:hypothetical protein
MNIERIKELRVIIDDPKVAHRHDTPYILLRELMNAILDDPPAVQKIGGVTLGGKAEVASGPKQES